MDYMARHGHSAAARQELVPGTLRIITVRMDYWPGPARAAHQVLDDPRRAYVSRYALGRDYHKLLRKRLQQLARRIEQVVGPFGYRAFTDSAPVLEKAIAQKAGLGWIGKHTNLIDDKGGSWFFLGELFTDLPLPVDTPATDTAAPATACIDICPTRAIVAPYQLDARRCISYLTIELRGPIPASSAAPSATASTAATTANWSAPGTALPGLPRSGVSATPATRQYNPDRVVPLERRPVHAPAGRLADPPYRLRLLVAQHCRGAGQRAHRCSRRCGAHGQAVAPFRTGTRTRPVGAAAAGCACLSGCYLPIAASGFLTAKGAKVKPIHA